MTDMVHTAMRKLTIKTQASENGAALNLFIVLNGIANAGKDAGRKQEDCHAGK
jgi:hypothetical protein